MLANWENVVSDVRNDIVFDGRNQEYGAYQLRRKYNWTVTVVLLSMAGAIALGLGVKKILSMQTEEIVQAPVLDVTQIDLTPPPQDETEPPPPPPPPPPPVMETVKFVPPVIKDDAVETDPPPPQEKIADTQVSTVTQEGDGDAVVVPQEETGTGTVVEEKKPEIFTVVEEMPEFPGGNAGIAPFIAKNIQYPQMAKEAGIQGKCYVNFVVSPTGEITNPKVIKNVPGCPECDKEALRVIKMLPNFKPGKQNGRAVSVQMNVPINYVLK